MLQKLLVSIFFLYCTKYVFHSMENRQTQDINLFLEISGNPRPLIALRIEALDKLIDPHTSRATHQF